MIQISPEKARRIEEIRVLLTGDLMIAIEKNPSSGVNRETLETIRLKHAFIEEIFQFEAIAGIGSSNARRNERRILLWNRSNIQTTSKPNATFSAR